MDVGSFVKGIGELLSGASSIKTGLESMGVDLGQIFSPKPAVDGSPKIEFHQVGSAIEPRIKLIRKMILKGYRDPRVRVFTAKVLSTKQATCPKCKAVNAFSQLSDYQPAGTVRSIINEHDLWFCGKCKAPIPESSITWLTPEKNWQREVITIYEVMRRNARYLRDLFNIDTYQSPMRTLETGSGDCDCVTVAMGAMAMSVGYPVAVRVMETKDPHTGKPAGTWSHIFLLVGVPPKAPKQWVPLDASLKAHAGWHPPKAIVHRVKDFDIKP